MAAKGNTIRSALGLAALGVACVVLAGTLNCAYPANHVVRIFDAGLAAFAMCCFILAGVAWLTRPE